MSNKFHPGPKPPDIRGDWKLDPKVNDTDVITIDDRCYIAVSTDNGVYTLVNGQPVSHWVVGKPVEGGLTLEELKKRYAGK